MGILKRICPIPLIRSAASLVLWVAVLPFTGQLAGSASAAPVQWSPLDGGNGHYYEVVDGPGTAFQRITWDQANTAAVLRSYLGLGGILATVTSEAETAFVSGLQGDPGSGFAWLGGHQPAGSTEPAGNWQWLTGEAWTFTNWDVETPNDFYFGDVGGPPAGSAEDALHSRPGGKWNDLPHDAFLPGYLVEYGEVPEPSLLPIIAAAALLLNARRLSPRGPTVP